jgi:hypothetical protein
MTQNDDDDLPADPVERELIKGAEDRDEARVKEWTRDERGFLSGDGGFRHGRNLPPEAPTPFTAVKDASRRSDQRANTTRR